MIVLSCRIIVKRAIYTHIYIPRSHPHRESHIHYFLIVLLHTAARFSIAEEKDGKGNARGRERRKNRERNFREVEFQTLITAREFPNLFNKFRRWGKSDSTRVTVFLRFTSPLLAYSIRFNEYRLPSNFRFPRVTKKVDARESFSSPTDSARLS